MARQTNHLCISHIFYHHEYFNIGELSCTAKQTAQCLGVSERTIQRVMRNEGISCRAAYSIITDDELDERVQFILHHLPAAGKHLLSILNSMFSH